MASLEQEMGELLLERHKRGLYPTKQGRLLCVKISHQINRLDQTVAKVFKQETDVKNHIHLGVSAELFEYFVALE